MLRYLIICLIFFTSCSKQDSSSVKTENENNSNTSSLTRERVDSLLVSNNIFQISYNEKYEQPNWVCLLYTSPSPRDKRQSRMPSSA